MPSLITLDAYEKLSDQIAHKLRASYEGKGVYSGIYVTVRKCTNTNGNPTGGVEIIAMAKFPTEETWRNKSFATRLRPHWNQTQFKHRVYLVMDKAVAELRRMRYALVVENMCRPFLDNPAFLKAVDEKKDWDSKYDEMTVEQSEKWTAWIEEWTSLEKKMTLMTRSILKDAKGKEYLIQDIMVEFDPVTGSFSPVFKIKLKDKTENVGSIQMREMLTNGGWTVV